MLSTEHAIGVSLQEGQAQIFGLLPSVASEIGVSIGPSGLMQPLKSLSLVIGLGRVLEERHDARIVNHVLTLCAVELDSIKAVLLEATFE